MVASRVLCYIRTATDTQSVAGAPYTGTGWVSYMTSAVWSSPKAAIICAGEVLHERAQEAPVGVGAFQAPAREVADDVVGDVVHGLVKVVTGPGLVVGQRGLQRGAGGVAHGCFPFVRGIWRRSLPVVY